jgi:Zn-finger in ubiquitin-hydrolases and other protein
MFVVWSCWLLRDSSPNKHGTRHFKETGHPVIKSYEPGENWKWCYVDEQFMK